jgi:hypothetical protein
MEITPVPQPTPAIGRGRLLAALLVLGPVVVLVFLPSVLGLHRYVVADGSMDGGVEGSIGRGSVALTREVPGTDLGIGDVIVFRPPLEGGELAAPVTRRVVAIEHGEAQTRGDNIEVDDPWRIDLSTADYPRVEFVVPWVGYPFTGQAGQGGWLLLVAMIAVALVLAVALSPRGKPRGKPRGARRRRRPGHPARFAGVR